jgi:hypothetical protein
MHHQPSHLARRSRLQRAQGMEIEEKVWRLYVAGDRQVAIAEKLGISATRVSRYLKRCLERIERDAPRSPEKLTEMREIMHDHLEAVYSEACSQPESLRSLALRLDCLASIVKLYGLNLEGSNRAAMPTQERPYAPPPVIMAELQKRALNEFGRAQDVEEVVKALTAGR